MSADITALISARKNSKYLAKFILGMWRHTAEPMKLRARVIMNEHDTWNDDLVEFFSEMDTPIEYHVEFYRENMGLGRAGLHEYFNLLLKQKPDDISDWTVYFCEDHYINTPGWDEHLRNYVAGKERSGDSEGKTFPLNPDDVWVLVPKFDNAGSMNHIVSRGFIKAMGGKLGRHGWIDSYINDVLYTSGPLRQRVILIDQEWFHDFTHDQPSPMSDAHLQSELSERGKNLPKYDSSVTRHRIALDRDALNKAIEEGKQ